MVDKKKYRQLQAMVVIFVGAIVAVAVVRDSYLLSVAGVITGMVFMVLVRSKARIRVDEGEVKVREKAAQLTYAIFAPTIGIGSFLMLFPSMSRLPVFAKGEFTYLESLGVVFAYLTLFLIAVYAIAYYFMNQKFGGGGNEE